MDTMQALTGHRSLSSFSHGFAEKALRQLLPRLRLERHEFGGLGLKTRTGIGAIVSGPELWVFVSTSACAVYNILVPLKLGLKTMVENISSLPTPRVS